MAKITVDSVITTIQKAIKEVYGLEIPADSMKGSVYKILKHNGKIGSTDKYKNYSHVEDVLNLLNSNLDINVEWEEIEHFTGNLFYAMRLATSRPLQEVDDLLEAYKRRYGENSKVYKQISTDFFLLKTKIKSNITKTWEYLEKTQLIGVNMIINKLLKSKTNVERSKNGKDLQNSS